jgi:hypothetical protein
MSAMSAVWSRKFLNFNSLNNAYITLTPKVEGAEQVKVWCTVPLNLSLRYLLIG